MSLPRLRAVEPLPDIRSSASVVVIGAGMAGLCAGWELKRAGCQVQILEARHRAGGRVRTNRDLPEGLYVEEGATRFPEVHHYTMHYLHLFNLPLIRFDRPEIGDTLRIMSMDLQHRHGMQDAWPASLGLLPQEQDLTLEELQDRYLTPLLDQIGDPLAPDWPSPAMRKSLDTIGWGELLRRAGASAGAIRALTLGFHVGEGVDSISALWWLQGMALDAGSLSSVKVAGGNDHLAEAFASQLAEELHFGQQAVGVEVDDEGIVVHADGPAGRAAWRADYVVCTLPLPVLAGLPIHPSLPPDQQQAIATIPYASLSRVALQCRSKFWLEQDRSGFTRTDEAVAEVWDLTTDEPGSRGVVVAYSGGSQARRVAAMAPDERISYSVDLLEPLMPGLGEHVEHGTSICWDEDPLARGGGAWFRPGDLALRPLAAAPHGRLYFAGEGASTWPGWVQGAFESARGVVSSILTQSKGCAQ